MHQPGFFREFESERERGDANGEQRRKQAHRRQKSGPRSPHKPVTIQSPQKPINSTPLASKKKTLLLSAPHSLAHQATTVADEPAPPCERTRMAGSLAAVGSRVLRGHGAASRSASSAFFHPLRQPHRPPPPRKLVYSLPHLSPIFSFLNSQRLARMGDNGVQHPLPGALRRHTSARSPKLYSVPTVVDF
jgi:hypothetical protein